MAQPSAPARRRGFFRGWWIVIAGAFHGFFGYGAWLYGFSVFVPPLLREMKLTSTQLGFSRSVGSAAGVLAGPFAGWFIERYGPRALATLGFTMGLVGWVITGLIPGPDLALLFVVVGNGIGVYLAMMMALYPVSQVWAAKWFIRRRSAAIGWITVGTGLGSTILLPVIGWMLGVMDWRTAAIITGVVWGILGIVTAWLWFPRYPPEHYGLRPDGISEEEYRQQQEAVTTGRVTDRLSDTSFTLGQAFRQWAFWGVSLAYIGYGLSGAVLPLFQNIALQEIGYTQATAANFYGVNFLFTTVGRLSVALIGDRFNPRWMLAFFWVLMAIGFTCFALIGVGGDPLLWAWAVIHGYGYGAVIPSHGIMKAYYFGRGAFGHIFGALNVPAVGIGIVAPTLIGWTRDVTGDYKVAFYVSAAAVLFAALMMVITPRPKPKAAAPAPATA